MTERLVDTFDCYTLEDLIAHLEEIKATAIREGHQPYVVYLKQERMQLIGRRLTDGSEVLDLLFKDIPTEDRTQLTADERVKA